MAKTKYFPFMPLFIGLTFLIVLTVYFLRENSATSTMISPDIHLFLAFFSGITLVAFQISMAGKLVGRNEKRAARARVHCVAGADADRGKRPGASSTKPTNATRWS